MKKKPINSISLLFMSAVLSLTLSACASKSAAPETMSAAPQSEASSNHDAVSQPVESTSVINNDVVDNAATNNKVASSGNDGPQSVGVGGSWSDNTPAGAVLTNPEDPWEGFNRAIFSFNDTVDIYFLKPVAKGYKNVTPEFMQKGVSNFFSNIGEISNLTNNALQGKKNGFVASTWRFVINTTVGVFGLFDVASVLGVRQYDEDFGQTLGYWGVSSGPYLVLPFFGPSTVRDTGGMAVDYMNYDPIDELDPNRDQKIGRWFLYAVEKRARYLSAESLVIGDRYSFIRDVYLQSRINEVYDGKPPQPKQQNKPSSEDSWGDESSTDSWGDESSDDVPTDSWGDSVSTEQDSSLDLGSNRPAVESQKVQLDGVHSVHSTQTDKNTPKIIVPSSTDNASPAVSTGSITK